MTVSDTERGLHHATPILQIHGCPPNPAAPGARCSLDTRPTPDWLADICVFPISPWLLMSLIFPQEFLNIRYTK